MELQNTVFSEDVFRGTKRNCVTCRILCGHIEYCNRPEEIPLHAFLSEKMKCRHPGAAFDASAGHANMSDTKLCNRTAS